jgi:hypothetical protein
MVFDSLYEEEKDHLYLKYTGDETDSVLSSLNEVFENCKKWNYSKLIIDLKDFNFQHVTDMTRFFFGEKIAVLSDTIHRMRIAVILKKKDYGGLGETAALNRGAWAKSFFNKDDAIKWLEIKI